MKETPYLEDRDDVLSRFSDIPFLQALEQTEQMRVLHLSKLRKYMAGEEITPEGAYDCWLYVLARGKVQIVKDEEVLATLDQAGDTFGELAIIDGEARSASVRAVEPTICLAIDASFIERLPEEQKTAFYAVFYRSLAEILARRLRITNQELVKAHRALDRRKT